MLVNPINDKVASVLSSIAQVISQSFNANLIIEHILKLLSTELNLTKGRIILPDQQTGILKIAHSVELSAEEKAKGIYSIGEGITGKVMSSGNAAVIPDVSKDDNYLARISNINELPKEKLSYVAVPIIRDNVPVGVFAVNPENDAQRNLDSYLYVLKTIAAYFSQILHIEELVKDNIHHFASQNDSAKTAKIDVTKAENNYGIIGRSVVIHNSISKALRAANSNASIMLIGESGTGKEKFARMIHKASHRNDKPFIGINCAAIPENLLESELFGHERGSFTGATGTRKGKFELASGGTLFLDEIGDMSLDLQSKLLRVLQENVIQRIGSNAEIPIDVRIITATHKNLQYFVNANRFRLDLYFRLNVVRVNLPPLRERPEDIYPIAKFLLQQKNEKLNTNISFSSETFARLEQFHWPGNVRQLENVIERAVLMSDGERINEKDIDTILNEESNITIQSGIPASNSSSDLQSSYDANRMSGSVRPYNRVRSEEKDDIINALRSSRGNKTHAAKQLGLTARQLHYRLAKLNIDVYSLV